MKNSLKDDENKNVRIKQDIFFGEVPLMTEEGTFVINGCRTYYHQSNYTFLGLF